MEPLYLEKDKIVILYAGNFYGDRKLNYLFNPIKKLFENGIILEEDLVIHVFGNVCNEDLVIIKDSGLTNLVISHPKVEYKKILSYMKGADILYLPQGGDVKYSVAFKFFDYLGSKKPILAVTSLDSAIFDIMQVINCGEIADISSCSSIYKALQNLIIKNKEYTLKVSRNYSWERYYRNIY